MVRQSACLSPFEKTQDTSSAKRDILMTWRGRSVDIYSQCRVKRGGGGGGVLHVK